MTGIAAFFHRQATEIALHRAHDSDRTHAQVRKSSLPTIPNYAITRATLKGALSSVLQSCVTQLKQGIAHSDLH